MSEEKRILQCLNCGQPFEPTCHITRQKFCCDACRHKYHNAKRHYDVPVDICPGCGDIVEQSGERGRRRRFCSDQCRVKYHARKVMERRQAREQTKAICPNCGKEFQAEWGTGKQRRFCSDPCRIEWWAAYHKANPSIEEPAETCATCGAPLPGKQKGQKYCSRFCYLLAMDQTHVEGTCQWCGRPIATTIGVERTYCSRECAAAGRYALRGFHKGSHDQCRGYPAMAGKADTGRQSKQKRHAREASPSCMRNDQHVHRPGWIDRNHPLSFAV